MDTADPRAILKAAGVECAEVKKMYVDYFAFGKKDVPWSAMDAILAIARLAVRYKWIAEHEGHHIAGEWYIDSRDEEELDFLECEADNA